MNKKYKKQVVEPDRVPSTVEDTIPIQKIFEDGIFLVGRNLWSKTFEFSDVNYEVASKDAKEDMFLQYSAILNAIEDGATAKITISNRFIPRIEFETKNMLPLQGDNLDRYRREYNSILERNVNLSTGVAQNKYFTITVEKSSIKEARVFFNRVGAEYKALFAKLGSRLTEVDEKEKIRIFFDFFHRGCEDDYLYDRLLYKRRKHSFKLALAPESMEFKSDYFKMDGRFGRVIYLKDYANFIRDSFLSELTAIDRNMMLSIDAEPIPIDKAIKQGKDKLFAVETNITNWQKKQNQNNNFSATVPYEMEQQKEESKEFLNDLVARDQRVIPALITIVHTAETKAQLDADTESIQQCARKNLCSVAILRWQQLEGLKTCLPYGGTKLKIRRTLTTESLAVFMPFRVQEVCHKNGIYLGNNAISKNMIMVNRSELLNGNSFITGVSGSGKSIMAKQEIVNLYLSDKNADIFIDEIYLLFQHEYSANFLFTLWKRVRKYGAFITGITQNVEDLLESHTARTMLANSELVVMLNQAATDRLELADLMGISEQQLFHITNVEAGHGLVKIGASLVPFSNRLPKDTELYRLMTTKPGE